MTFSGVNEEPASRLLPFNLYTYTKNAKEPHKPAAELSLPYTKEILRILRGEYLQETF